VANAESSDDSIYSMSIIGLHETIYFPLVKVFNRKNIFGVTFFPTIPLSSGQKIILNLYFHQRFSQGETNVNLSNRLEDISWQ